MPSNAAGKKAKGARPATGKSAAGKPSAGSDLLVENFHIKGSPKRAWPKKIVWWDETLRDGEQTPGVYYTLEEKVELARLISAAGVDVMNVGIPAVSPNELKAVKAIAREGLDAKVLGAARTVRSDIDAVIQSDASRSPPSSPRPRSTSSTSSTSRTSRPSRRPSSPSSTPRTTG